MLECHYLLWLSSVSLCMNATLSEFTPLMMGILVDFASWLFYSAPVDMMTWVSLWCTCFMVSGIHPVMELLYHVYFQSLRKLASCFPQWLHWFTLDNVTLHPDKVAWWQEAEWLWWIDEVYFPEKVSSYMFWLECVIHKNVDYSDMGTLHFRLQGDAKREPSYPVLTISLCFVMKNLKS